MTQQYGLGAHPSPYDVRTFTYAPTGIPGAGGKRYEPEDIEHQHSVGICTAISLTQQARKVLGKPFSAEFQYLMQKRNDRTWEEGSSLTSSLKVAKNIGLLPAEHWTYTTEADRMLPYSKYIAKLRAVPESEIERLKTIASQYRISAYERVPISKQLLGRAIIESQAGILCRFEIGEEWWDGQIEPLRPPKEVISGHGIDMTNYSGDSYRLANTWGAQWADKGTAYGLFSQYKPTEAWLVHYTEAPPHVQEQLAQLQTMHGTALTLLQKIVELINNLKQQIT